MKIKRTELQSLCREYGQLLHVPASINGPQLLWAISGNESMFGEICTPRHELGYCTGRYASSIHALTHEWGCLAHCSYGPWQLMASNSIEFTPMELLTNYAKCAKATVDFINRVIFKLQGAKTLTEIADAYNSGNFRDGNIPTKYIQKLIWNYSHASLPQSQPGSNSSLLVQ